MSSPQPQWQQPVLPLKKRSKLKVTLISIAASILFCFVGTVVLGLIVGEPPKETKPPTAQQEAAQRQLAAPVPTSARPTVDLAPPALSKPPTTPPPPPPSSRAAAVRTSSPAAARSTSPKPRPTTKKPTPKPKPTTTKPKPTKPAGKLVSPGAFCSPVGATGIGKNNGKVYKCIKKAGEKQARWRQP